MTGNVIAHKARPCAAWRALALVGLLGGLLGCTAERGAGNRPEPIAVAPGGPALTPPPVAMAGRWKLSSPGGGVCAVTFGGQGGAAEGAMAPEGGCPGDFYTSRKWSFEGGSLIVRDHTGKPLGQLAFTNGRFEGQSAAGQAITLAR